MIWAYKSKSNCDSPTAWRVTEGQGSKAALVTRLNWKYDLQLLFKAISGFDKTILSPKVSRLTTAVLQNEHKLSSRQSCSLAAYMLMLEHPLVQALLDTSMVLEYVTNHMTTCIVISFSCMIINSHTVLSYRYEDYNRRPIWVLCSK